MQSRAKHLQKMLEGFHNWKANITGKDCRMPHGFHITGSQWLVLSVLSREGKASIKEISAALNISSSAATQIVNELLKQGSAIKRADPADGRVAVVALSAKAKRDMASMRSMMLKRMLKMYSVLNDREFGAYMALTDKIIAGVKHTA